MRTRGRSVDGGIVLAVVCSLVAAGCSSPPAPAALTAPAAPAAADLTPVLSIQELMEHIVDPTADWIFDAAVIDVSAAGTRETKPISDDDWLQVERGALLLAESANLLKMPRAVVAAGTPIATHDPGQPAPELSPAEIQAKIDEDRARWNAHADELRVVALESLTVVKARNAEGLFDVGNRVDQACESCHLEYWYPGDKAAVLADQQKRVTYDPPKN